MIPFSNACIGTSLLSFVLGLFVLFKTAKAKEHLLWSCFSFSVASWSLGLAMMVRSGSSQEATFWLRWVHYLGAIMIPICFFHFASLFLNLHLKRHIQMGYLFAGLQQILSIFGFLAYVEPLPPFNFYTLPKPAYGIFVIYFFYYVAYAHWLLFQHMRKSQGLLLNKIKYIFLGTSIGFCGGSTAFLPVFHLPVFPYGVYGVAIYILTVTIAILKHRLMDIELLAREFLGYAATALLLACPLLSLTFISHNIWVARFLVFCSVTAGFGLFYRLYPIVQDAVDRYVFKGRLSAKAQMKMVQKQAVRLSNLKDLVDNSVRHVLETLRVTSATLYFHDLTTNNFTCVSRLPVSEADMPSYSDGDERIKSFKTSRELDPEAAEQFQGWTAVIPLHQESGLFGFLLLGDPLPEAGSLTRSVLEDVRQTLEHPLIYAYVFYEQSMMLDKFTHDNIRYANNIRRTLEIFQMQFGKDLTPAQRPFLDIIDRQAQLLEGYLCDLREIMSILAQRMQGRYKLEPYNVTALVQEVWPAETVRAQQQGITLLSNALSSTSNSPKSVWGWGAQNSIRHIIENLLSNAMKFTPKGGTVRLDVKDLGDHIELVISDTGPGIPAESLPHIFDLFYQGKGRESMEKSTGLGLSIVKEIVALHQGNIDVISEEGQGTSFFVRLPSAAKHQVKAA